MNLGETQLQFVDETRDGPLVALSWDRAIGRRSRLSLFARQDFEDPGDQFAEGLSADLGVEGDASSSPDPRIRRTAGIEYGLGRERARMSWLLSRNSDHAAVEVETETPVQEREGARVAMTFAYPFGQAWMMNVGAALVREEVTDFEGVSNQREAYVDFSRALGRSLSLSIEYDRFERDSDFGEQGDEHRILLSLVWVAN
jgi:hypothetical protein